MWRSLLNAGRIQPSEVCQAMAESILPNRVHVANDVVAKHNYGASVYYHYTLAEVKRQSRCWNCRGFGHLAACCPSEIGGRSTEHIASMMHPHFGKKPQRKQQAGRVQCYVENDIAYSLNGVSLGSVNSKATEPHEHVVEIGMTHDPLTTMTRWCIANEHQM